MEKLNDDKINIYTLFFLIICIIQSNATELSSNNIKIEPLKKIYYDNDTIHVTINSTSKYNINVTTRAEVLLNKKWISLNGNFYGDYYTITAVLIKKNTDTNLSIKPSELFGEFTRIMKKYQVKIVLEILLFGKEDMKNKDNINVGSKIYSNPFSVVTD